MHPHALENFKFQAERFVERLIEFTEETEKKEKLEKILEELREISFEEN